MANYTNFSRPGAINNSGDPQALALKQFAGEVMAAYNKKRVVSDKVVIKTITKGKSEQFPIIGRATAEYHTPGSEIDPKGIKSAERIINVDALMTASTFVDNWEEKVMHYETRAEYSKQLGEALRNAREQHAIINLIKASKSVKVIDDADQQDGKTIVNDKFKIAGGGAVSVLEQAAAVCVALFQAQEMFDDADIPEDDRNFICRPNLYYAVVQAVQDSGFSAIHADYDGQGSYSKGTVLQIAGINMLKTPHIPKTNITKTGLNLYHYGDFSKVIGNVFSRGAIGILDLIGLKIESEYQIIRQGDIIVASQSYGMGVLRPECSITFELDALTNL